MATLASTIPSPQSENQLLVCSWVVVVLVTLLTTTGCSNQTSKATAATATEVEVADVEQRDVPIYFEWIGTLDGFVNADIKAQVSGYLLEQAYTGGFVREEGSAALSNRSTAVSGGVGTGARPASAVSKDSWSRREPQLAQAEAQVAVAEANQRRTQLDVDRYTPLGAAAGHHAAGPGQRDAEQSGREGAGAVGAGASGDRQGADHRGQRRGSIGEGRRRNGADQPGIHPAHLADRRYPGHRAAAGGCAGESGEPDHHHRVDARSDQGLFHGQRAGISRLSQALLDAGHPGRGAEAVAAGAHFGGWDCLSAKWDFLLCGSPGRRQDRRHPGRGTVPESGKHLAARPIRQGPHGASECNRARCWCRNAPSSSCRAAIRSPWWMATTK